MKVEITTKQKEKAFVVNPTHLFAYEIEMHTSDDLWQVFALDDVGGQAALEREKSHVQMHCNARKRPCQLDSRPVDHLCLFAFT